MKPNLESLLKPFLFAVLPTAVALWGCEAKAPTTSGGDAHDHSADDGHDHDHDHGSDADHAHEDSMHGEPVALGEQEIDGLRIRASHDGPVEAGHELPIDVWVEGGTAVASVRFWVGVESGAGSVKARAELEADNWHTHAEVPAELPEGSAIWVQVELEDGRRVLVDFAFGSINE